MTDLKVGVCQTELPWGGTSGAAASEVVLACAGIKSVGANQIRMTVRWSNLDPAFDHNYRWGDLDTAVGTALLLGLEIHLVIDPTRAVFSSTSPNLNVVDEFGILCGAICYRYMQHISRWEIGNSVNTIENFGFPSNPARYTEYLASAWAAIKALQPSALVFNGALASHLATDWSHMEAVEWTRVFYQSNPQGYFDGFAVHAYMLDGENNARPAELTAPAFVAIDGIRATMNANGDGAKKIHVVEWGFDSVRTVSTATTTEQLEDEQASQMLVQANLLQGLVDAGTIDEQTFLYNYRDWEGPNRNPLNHQGLVTFDFREKKAARMMRGWNNRHTVAPAAAADAVVSPVDLVFVVGAVILNPNSTDAVTPVPTVIVPVPVPVVGMDAVAPVPTMTVLREVEYVATSAGDRSTVSGSTITVEDSLAVPSGLRGGMVVVGVVFSHAGVKDWATYTSFGVTSDLDGPLTRLSSTHLGAVAAKPGSAHLFGLFLPSVGTHTLTATASGTTFASATIVSVLYKGVSGWGTAGSATGSSGTPQVSVTTRPDDRIVVVAGQGESPGTWNIDDRFSDGGSVDGVGDYMTLADGAGAGTGVLAAMSTSSTAWGVAGINLRQWDDGHIVPEIPVTVASAVSAMPILLGGNLTNTTVATAVTPSVTVPVVVSVPNYSATAVVPIPTFAGGVDFVDSDGSTAYTTISNQRKMITLSVEVTEAGGAIVAGFFTSVQSGGNLTTLTCSSNLSGSLTKVKSVYSGNNRGTHMFAIFNPAVGTHTLTFNAQTGILSSAPPVHNVQAAAASYKNVGGYTGAVTKAATGVLDLVVTAAGVGSQCVMVGSFDGDPGVFDKTTRERLGTLSVGGNPGLVIMLGDADGEGDFSTTTSRAYRAVGASLNPPTI